MKRHLRPQQRIRNNAMRLPIWIIFVFVVAMTGCVRLQPAYLIGSDIKKAWMLYDNGMIIEARQRAADVPRDSVDYPAAKRLIGEIDELASEISLKFADIGLSYEKAGLHRSALTQYELALQYNPANQIAKKKTAMLVEKIRLAESSGGFDPAEHYDKGRAALTKGAYLKAVEELELVARYAPDYKDARELLVKASKEKKEAFERHLKRGIGYFEAEEMELAIKEWDRALELEPGNRNALDYRVRAVEVLKRLKKIREKDVEAR